jgi:hypothetical protein
MGSVFDPDKIQEVVQACASQYGGDGNEKLLRELTSNLAQTYPGQINEDWNWIYSITGGCCCQITMLHVSLSEYLLIESYPIPMTGFTGRYRPAVYEFVVAGHEEYFRAGQLEAQRYGPGDRIVFQPGEAACVNIPDSLITVGYARGAIPTMFTLPVMDTVFGSLDYRSLWQTIAQSTVLMWRSITGQPQGGRRH